MTFREYNVITEKYIKEILAMAEKKGIEYANSKDRLSWGNCCVLASLSSTVSALL